MSDKSIYTKNIFITAKQFSNASSFLSDFIVRNNEPDLSLPSIINDVISVEVYFKCLYAIENVDFTDIRKIEKTLNKCGHNIKKIFNKLTSESQSKIKDNFQEYVNTDRMLQMRNQIEISTGEPFEYHFENSMEENCQAFEILRYAFEKSTWGSFTGSGALKFAVLSRIEELKPEWFIQQQQQVLSIILRSNESKITKKPISSEEIFKHADRFAKAVYFLCDHLSSNDQMNILFPIFVNMALTLELYFKCLYHIENNNIIEGHDIEAIFKQLTSESQSQIRNYYQNFIETDVTELKMKEAFEKASGEYYDNSIENALRDFSHAFINYRYAYEKKFGSTRGYMPLKMAILSRIKQLRPSLFEER